MARLKRRTQHQRFGERMPSKKTHWLKLFPHEIKVSNIEDKVQKKIQPRLVSQEVTQRIGKIREQKVLNALQDLKNRREIRDFLPVAKLSYLDLIEGVDFVFIYIDGCYKICKFSVTGGKWVEQHKQQHPEIPVLAIGLGESQESIEQKIMNLIKKDRVLIQ
jgi:hypothetical protein